MLLDRSGAIPDLWTRIEGPELGTIARPLVTLEALPAALGRGADGEPVGVAVPNTVSVASLAPHLPRLTMIAVAFPGFGDGRGFSIARLLRRAGYTGRLRAVGPLIPDQFAYALACGFDEVELSAESAARQSPAQWRAAAAPHRDGYQRGYERDGSILDRRRARAKG